MTKEIIISEQENIAATFENGKITEFFMNEGEQLVGDIILGKVDSTIQSIDAAFVSIGKNRNGFIHITDLCVKNAKRKTGIRNHLQPKQSILVQIAKEATGSKGPRLTGMLTIPGKYIILTPYERKVGISKKITDSYERDRLVYISKKICQSGYGIIVRTEAIGQSEEALKEDLDFLLKRWSEILKMSETMQAPAVLYRDQDLLYRVLRDAVTPDVDKIVVDSQDARARSIDLLQSWSHNAFRLVQQNRSPIPLSHQYNIFSEIEKVLQPKAPLPSGGYLVIEKTEALTVIDVNSGSTKGTSGLNETILQTNKEAAVEIARQLKLRDIGGVIVIDFIDMLDQREQQIVWQILANAVKDDKAQPQLGYFSEFSLLEMTRHRQKKSITELLTTKCPYCDGIGYLRNNVYRSDLLTTDSVRKRVNRFDDNDNGNNNRNSNDNLNSKKMEELTNNIDYVENKMDRVPPHVTKHRDENTSSNQITYPKFDRNNNKFDDNVNNDDNEDMDSISNVNEVEVIDIQDNRPKIDQESLVEEVYESLGEPENKEKQEESTDNFVVELTKEERMYIESIEDPFDNKRSFKDKKFGKHKKEFQKRDRFNNYSNDRQDRFNKPESDNLEVENKSEIVETPDRNPNQRNDRNPNQRFDRNNNQRNDRYPNDRQDRFNKPESDNNVEDGNKVESFDRNPNQRNDRFNPRERNFPKHIEQENNFVESKAEQNSYSEEVENTKSLQQESVFTPEIEAIVEKVETPVIKQEEVKAVEVKEETSMPAFIDEVVVIEEPAVVLPKKRGRKPAPKKVKAKETVTEEVVSTQDEKVVEKVEEVKEKVQVAKIVAETPVSPASEKEDSVALPKPKKRGRIKSFSPKKRK